MPFVIYNHFEVEELNVRHICIIYSHCKFEVFVSDISLLFPAKYFFWPVFMVYNWFKFKTSMSDLSLAMYKHFMSIIDSSVPSVTISKSKYMFINIFVFFESNNLDCPRQDGVLELSFLTNAILKITDVWNCLGHQNCFEVDIVIIEFTLLTPCSNWRICYWIVFVFCNQLKSYNKRIPDFYVSSMTISIFKPQEVYLTSLYHLQKLISRLIKSRPVFN